LIARSRSRRATSVSNTHRVDARDPTQFAAKLESLSDCDGIALLAPDLPPIKLAINELVRAGVHVVTLFSDVAGSMRETHVGADNRAAGRTAGLLLARMAQTQTRNTLLLSSQATRMSDLPSDDPSAASALTQYLRNEIDAYAVAGIYNVGAAGTGVVSALAECGLTSQTGVVLHDFTDAHRDLLSAGAVSYLLHQDIHYCVLAAARVLRALCENVRGALNVVQPRIEILTAENIH
jgi:LacI family transcriptional regulator